MPHLHKCTGARRLTPWSHPCRAAAKPRPQPGPYTSRVRTPPIHTRSNMNTLPTKKPGDPDVNTIPTWRELAERFRDLVKDFLKEGKELGRARAKAAPGAETLQAG